MSHGYITGLYGWLITAMCAVEMHDPKMYEQNQAINVTYLNF